VESQRLEIQKARPLTPFQAELLIQKFHLRQGLFQCLAARRSGQNASHSL